MKSAANSAYVIQSLQKKWQWHQVISRLLLALAITTVLTALGYTFLNLPWWWSVPVFVVTGLILLTVNRSWQVSPHDVSRLLNQNFPQLEESSELVLQPNDSLNFLQQLQRKKIEQTLPSLARPIPVPSQLKTMAILAGIALVASFAITNFPYLWKSNYLNQPSGFTNNKTPSQRPEEILPQLTAFSVSITPPSYTRNKVRRQDQTTLKVEEGSQLQWHLSTNIQVENIQLLFNEKDSLILKPEAETKTQWTGQKTLYQSGFYQVNIDGKLSELYQIEVIPDQPPVINITQPEPHTVIDFGAPQQVNLKVALSDDYGVQQASINATLASGSGENVSFQEKQLSFETPIKGSKNYNLVRNLDLNELGMKPGDELYFYVKAQDNHQQESRSDVYFVILPDTAELMSMDGMTMGVSLVPEYFRSQRQIIIDTEKLIKEKDSMAVNEFQNRSNNLGIDQKLLRLRYGKFLGEEAETYAEGSGDHEEGEGHEEGGDHHEENESQNQGFGDPQDVLHSFGHAHDNSEDATFFDPEQKAQLKATLTEMWNAELQLRTFKPKDALPYEYKALRLLKDLQQKSRAYVGKTSVKTPPLKPEKRLSGELEDITETVYQFDVEIAEDGPAEIKKAVALMESLRLHGTLSNNDQHILKQTSLQLNKKAAEQPAGFLKAANALRNILSNPAQIKEPDINLVEQALQKMIRLEARLPQPSVATPSRSLTQQYFDNLNRMNP